ncbi:FAD/NAD-binding domain-containing protein [Pluteus cervinus]|uniref:FAD/NAD-binding domain-containing protein n=1 Tax=Pluteus cervinus TaxID=181527 RepID=A0ACD3BCF9_9AGAR|nr:FAD/NAD-binding domain-containing protein [Pluteus cervinus]
MSETSSPFVSRLPILDKLGVSPAAIAGVDAVTIASTWFQLFAARISEVDIDGTIDLLQPDALWKDHLALTWDFRCFDGVERIRTFLRDRLAYSGLGGLKLKAPSVVLQRPFPDLAWIVGMFDFETSVGSGTGVFRLVPTALGEWRGFTVFTNLEELKGFPEKIGPHRSRKVVPGAQWRAERQRKTEFETSPPTVLIVGGGHCGLELAARLKMLDVSTLVVEAEGKIGDKWRNRYDSLCLHWPVWYDHMAYIPFPPSWPVYTPAPKMGDWLESYAKSLELNVWASSTVLNAIQDEISGKWRVKINRNGVESILTVTHLVFATGLGDKYPNIPKIPDQEKFRGITLHSTQFKRASDYEGKKVLVVGAGNSGHDVSADLANHGVDVTMFQRSSTFVMNIDRGWKFLGGALYSETSLPTEVADRLFASMPHILQENGMAQRATKAIEADYKETLDGLRRVGFKLNSGIKDAGILLLLKKKMGGHYFDIGASQLIIDGNIKIKNDAQISRFTENGLVFDNGTEFQADVVVFATGTGSLKEPIREICGDAVADKCKAVHGLDEEGEINGWYRELGVKGLWYMLGPLQLARFYSKHLALQIKAKEEGVFGTVYSLQ